MAEGRESTSLQAVASEFASLSLEFDKFEVNHKEYLQHLEKQFSLQSKCMKDLHHFKYRLKQLSDSLNQAGKSDTARADELRHEITLRRLQLSEIGESYPRQANIYLRTVLGNVNLSLLNKTERFAYKDEYEHFKLVVTIVSVVLAFCNLFVFKYRVTDAAYHFMLVWYYCTLTIREGILRLNGSRIQAWWVAHHYISTFLTGVLVTWPESAIYQEFRTQFYLFSMYLGLVQILQYRYQHGQLYKLKALGERGSMDITVEGFHSWMWRGLGFLLPFLFGGYLFQLYNSYVLWNLAKDPRCHEWQVRMCSFIFFVLFVGNTLTTLSVIFRKFRKVSRREDKATEAARRRDSAGADTLRTHTVVSDSRDKSD